MIHAVVANTMTKSYGSANRIRVFLHDWRREEEVPANSRISENVKQSGKALFYPLRSVRQETWKVFFDVDRQTKGSHKTPSDTNRRYSCATLSQESSVETYFFAAIASARRNLSFPIS